MKTLDRMKLNGISETFVSKLFKINRTALHLTLTGERKTHEGSLTAINQYIDSVEEINNKFRRL